jgi:hypothetical protein
MPSEAEKYWRYSRECTRQAVEAETQELRDQLLTLARLWIEAAMCEKLNANDCNVHLENSVKIRSSNSSGLANANSRRTNEYARNPAATLTPTPMARMTGDKKTRAQPALSPALGS